MKRQESRADATLIEPSLQVGKSGIESMAEELKKQLKLKKLIKVKFLKSAIAEGNKQDMAVKLADLTNSDLIEVRGNTAVFRRKG
ncbi:MAG: YhbY family RNA-binding protein [Candidatus Methanoperedens sp.]|nr:YhbY family RNA-binding protein [Candidatus Methanoperedens sp.]MCZ7369337.1 YhbY family RNA-binding protein [Candidatus Methanoperedens sp.]